MGNKSLIFWLICNKSLIFWLICLTSTLLLLWDLIIQKQIWDYCGNQKFWPGERDAIPFNYHGIMLNLRVMPSRMFDGCVNNFFESLISSGLIDDVSGINIYMEELDMSHLDSKLPYLDVEQTCTIKGIYTLNKYRDVGDRFACAIPPAVRRKVTFHTFPVSERKQHIRELAKKCNHLKPNKYRNNEIGKIFGAYLACDASTVIKSALDTYPQYYHFYVEDDAVVIKNPVPVLMETLRLGIPIFSPFNHKNHPRYDIGTVFIGMTGIKWMEYLDEIDGLIGYTPIDTILKALHVHEIGLCLPSFVLHLPQGGSTFDVENQEGEGVDACIFPPDRDTVLGKPLRYMHVLASVKLKISDIFYSVNNLFGLYDIEEVEKRGLEMCDRKTSLNSIYVTLISKYIPFGMYFGNIPLGGDVIVMP